jgi:hypothetical protein
VLYRNDVLFHQSDADGVLADILMGDSCHHLVDRSQGGLLFHSAALMWKGRCLILPGTIGAGKSTLTAWLISRGLGYLTDELVFVPWGADTVQTFTRPLNLKRPSREPLRGYFDYADVPVTLQREGHVWSTAFNDLISPEALGAPERLDPPELNQVLFPRYDPLSPFELQRLSKAQAGLALMECLVNARNLPDHGFAEVARLARNVPAHMLHYSRFEDLGTRIEELLRSA